MKCGLCAMVLAVGSLAAAQSLTEEEALGLEAHLRAEPDDVQARGKLIAHYQAHGVREARLQHILWLIEHHPESEAAVNGTLGIGGKGAVLDGPADAARAAELWREAMHRHTNDTRVQANGCKVLGCEIAEPHRGAPEPSVRRVKTNPKAVTRAPLVYPPLARQARISGTVRVRLKIDADGHVTEATVVRGHPLLEPAAMDSLKKWVFEPGEALTELDVGFELVQ